MHSVNKTYTFSPYLSLAVIGSLILGSLIGVLYPYSGLRESLLPISRVLVSIVLYCVVPAIFFAEIIAICQLIRKKLIGFVIKRSLRVIAVFLGVLVLVGVVIVLLLPAINILPLVSSPENIAPITFSTIFEELFPPNFLTIFAISQENILALLVCGAMLAVGYTLRSNKSEVFFTLLSELKNISDILVEYVSYAVVIICALSSYALVSQFVTSEYRGSFTPLLLSLTALLLVLIFVIIPQVFRHLGVSIRYKDWLGGMLTSCAIAFSTGSVLVAHLPTLALSSRKNSRNIVTHVSYTFALIFGRIGTATCIIVFYIALFNSFYATPILLREILVIVVLSILLSFVASARTQSIIFIAIVNISRVSYVSIQDFYLVLLPYALIIQSFAAAFDVLCINTVNLLVNSHYEKRFIIFSPPAMSFDDSKVTASQKPIAGAHKQEAKRQQTPR